MVGSWPTHDLPNLTDETCVVRSPATTKYNCIAWATSNTGRWWWPDPLQIGYWPPNVLREVTFDAFVLAFSTLGYVPCEDGAPNVGIEKIALFGTLAPDGVVVPTHAALQSEDGRWTSKLGTFEDIEHATLTALDGPVYGAVVCYLKRPRPG